VAVALYAAGVSQHKAAEVMSFLLGHRYSHETISAMTEEVLQAVEAFRRRPLPEEMAFVYPDGLYLKLRREGEGVVREVVYVALGVTPSGERQVLGYWLLPAESALGWEGVLGELWQRGLRRVLLFITDGLPGLPEAIRRVYPQAEWQRCVVHGVRWSLGQVRARDRVLLAEDLRRVYGAESRGEALRALEALREAWGSRYPGVVALWAGDSGAFLRFYGYPKVLWPYLRSTNLMERFIREIRRGTKVRGQAEGLSCPQVSQRGGGVQAPLPGSRASARILGRRGKLLREANILQGGGRSGCFAKRTSCGSRGSRRRGRRWRRCFRSGMPPVHKRLHIHLDTTFCVPLSLEGHF
jgi:putative transposase